MVRVARIALAAILALALAALPLVLGRCAESCEALHAATPPCHHVTATGTHISPLPSSCGHDHSSAALAAAQRAVSIERAFIAFAASAGQSSVESAMRAGIRVRPHSPPAISPSLGGRTLPLRV